MTIEKNRRFTYLALLSAVAIALNLLESIYIGPIFGVLRLGLANIAALLALKLMGRREMIIVNVMRVVIGNLLRGTIFSSTFWISSGGVILSSLVMLGMDKLDSSLLFTSIIGSIAHSSGQVLIVSFLYRQAGMAAILPYLLLGSIPTGILIGTIAKLVLTRIRPLKLK
ncbi:MAG: Gx transporter family protein [Solobacterium sp.]|jgi:heptaprenyl diphosphate synthase|nr:Gx transporter family protein [Solobacterium sp.]